MKVLKLIYVVLPIVFITSCTKDSFNNQIEETTPTEHHDLYALNGMLVFDSQESFDAALKRVQEMDDSERKEWEENLGFKSFDRTISEIMNKQTEYEEKYAGYDTKELEKLLKNQEIEEYLPLTKEYIEKRVIEIHFNENNEQSMDVNYPLYSSLINIDGFVVVGNEILQYTKNKFKLIKSLDFSKTKQLVAIKDNTNDESFFVTDIIQETRNKVTIGNIFSYSAESYTTDRKKVTATEIYRYYDRHYDGRNYMANYSLIIENEKKIFTWRGWKWVEDKAQTWIWGNFDFKTAEDGTFNVSLSYPDQRITTRNIQIVDRVFSRYGYNSVDGGPEILHSTWNVVRTGGPHGLGVRLIDHVRYERF